MVLRAHGRAVESLGGRYITAVDVGTSSEDMEYMRMETEHVVGLPTASGDPSPVTAFGVFQGIRAAIAFKFGGDDLEGSARRGPGARQRGLLALSLPGGGRSAPDGGRHRAGEGGRGGKGIRSRVRGAGTHPCRRSRRLRPVRLGRRSKRRHNLRTPGLGRCRSCEQSAPTERQDTATVLREGGDPLCARLCGERGGLIHVYGELRHWGDAQVRRKVSEIRTTLLGIFEVAAREGISPNAAANRVVEERIRRTRHLERTFLA